MPNSMHKRYMLGWLTRIVKAGPNREITPPKLGIKVISAATRAQTGARGTRSSNSPISHRTPTQSPWIVTARHQLNSALPAVRM